MSYFIYILINALLFLVLAPLVAGFVKWFEMLLAKSSRPIAIATI